MYMFIIEAKPTSKSKHAKSACGAFVNCFIDYKDSRIAQHIAEILIEKQGWIVKSKQRKFWNFKNIHDIRPKDKLYYREAKQYGSCLVFNTWPKKELKR